MFSFIQKPITNRVVFLHVPKCGGTTLNTALSKKFKKSQVFHLEAAASARGARKYYSDRETINDDYYHVLKFRESILFYVMSQKHIKFISGHFPFNQNTYNAFHDEVIFITILRDPVKRYISQYFDNRYRNSNHCSIDVDLEDFLSSSQGNAFGTEYVKFFGGLRLDSNYRSEQAIKSAISNLKKFDLLGRLENISDFASRIAKALKIKITIKHFRKSPVSIDYRNRYLSSDVISRIEKICAPDLEVYHSFWAS